MAGVKEGVHILRHHLEDNKLNGGGGGPKVLSLINLAR